MSTWAWAFFDYMYVMDNVLKQKSKGRRALVSLSIFADSVLQQQMFDKRQDDINHRFIQELPQQLLA